MPLFHAVEIGVESAVDLAWKILRAFSSVKTNVFGCIFSRQIHASFHRYPPASFHRYFTGSFPRLISTLFHDTLRSLVHELRLVFFLPLVPNYCPLVSK